MILPRMLARAFGRSTGMRIVNNCETPLWVPASLKAPDPAAVPGMIEATYGKLEIGEAVTVTKPASDAIKRFIRQAGDRIRVEGG